jgi:ubiquinone/menaquinone biosynthesis C-methylase UbiE
MQSHTPPVCDYEGSDYQASFWGQGERSYEDQVEAAALRRLLPPGGRLLLEIGAGAGRNTPRYHGFERIVLLDYAHSQLAQAQQRLGRSQRYIYVAADVYRLPFVPGLFEAATMIRTLHHLAEPPLALAQVRRALQPGAVFILEYANKHNLKAILRYLLRQQSWSPFSREAVEFAALNFDFHPAEVRDWLAGSQFAVQRQLTVSHFRLELLKRWLPLRLLVALDSLAQLSGDWWQLSPSVFVRAQALGDGPPPARPERVEDYFACSKCSLAPLKTESEGLACPGCGQSYAIRDGIYDFRF